MPDEITKEQLQQQALDAYVASRGQYDSDMDEGEYWFTWEDGNENDLQ